MYKFNITNLAQINSVIFGQSGIVGQLLSSLSSFTPQPDSLENILDLHVH